MFSKYETKARVFPAIITILPILIFSHFYLYKIVPDLLNSIIATKIIGDISIFVIFLYTIIQIARFSSKKFLQDNLFKNELHFPTTNYLMYADNHYTKEYKEKVRSKLKNDFNILLFSKYSENNDENGARKIINDAVKLIRNKVKDGRLLLQHNIEYGFIRNLIGGLVISLPMSLFNVFFFFIKNDTIAFISSLILFSFFVLLLIFHKKILKYFAYNYADVLFNEYLSI